MSFIFFLSVEYARNEVYKSIDHSFSLSGIKISSIYLHFSQTNAISLGMADFFFIHDNIKGALPQSLTDIESLRLATVGKKDPTEVYDLLNNLKRYAVADGKIVPNNGTYLHEYDAAVDATAIGTVPFRGPQIPAGSRVLGQYLVIETAAAGATTLGIGTADGTGSTQTDDIYPQAAVGVAYTASPKVKATTPQFDDQTTYIDISAGFVPTLNIVGGALTAGKIRLFTTVETQ